MAHRNPIEVAKTVLEVADVAWKAVECSHHLHRDHHEDLQAAIEHRRDDKAELESLRAENRRLRDLLEQNLNLLQNLVESPCLLEDCPPDLHARLMTTVDSEKFLTQVKYLHHESFAGTDSKFLVKEATGPNLQAAEVLVNVGLEEPSWWMWVTDEMVPRDDEEHSEIDDESYLILSEEQVVDGVANFMARCILSNPKALSLSPDELQKTLTKALGGMNKLDKMLNVWHAGMIFYTLSTWGLAIAGLYKGRSILKLAAKGVHTTSKLL